MVKNQKTIPLLLFIFVALLFIVSNTPLLTSKYGKTLDQLDADVRWEFFQEQLLTTEQAKTLYGTGDRIGDMPHRFIDHYDTPQTYGSYVTKFKLPDHLVGEKIAFYIPYEYGSYELYADGQLVMRNGAVGATKEEQQPRNAPTIGQITLHNQEVYVVLQLANFYSNRGGFGQPIQLGEPLAMIERHNTSIIFQFFVNGIIFIIGLYLLLFGLFNQRNEPTVLFALFSLTIAVRTFFARPYIYSITVVSIPWEYAVKIEVICTMLATGLAVRYCYYWFASYASTKILYGMYAVGFLQLLLTVFTDAVVFQKTFVYLYWMPLAAFVYIVAVALRKYHILNQFNLFQFLGMCIIFASALHDFLAVKLMLDRPAVIHIAVCIYIIMLVVSMSWQYAQKLQETVQLNKQILQLNRTLDAKIQARTKELELANEQLKELASRDALTGIGNRHVFNSQLAQQFDEAQRDHSALSLLLIDLDNFKKYNDHYGHTAGDELLRDVVKTMARALPEEAIFARYGGEEFAVLVPHMEQPELVQLGERVVHVVAAERYEHAAQDSSIVTVSVGGYTMTPGDAFYYPRQLVDAADKQLYLAKNGGKNRFVCS